jgi:citrate synthase
MTQPTERIRSRLWQETADPDNPYSADLCRCSGYDVYGDLLGKASWIEYLYLLFTARRPLPAQTRLLECLAVALANGGPRDHAVRAAMNAGVGGSTHASCLMAALAVGAGQLGGAHEVAIAMTYWRDCGQILDAWCVRLRDPVPAGRADVWPALEHAPGFDAHGTRCSRPVQQTLTHLVQLSPGPALPWLHVQRVALEDAAGRPLAMSGVAAAAMVDLGLDEAQGEMLYLLLRLPGAAVHALEQERYGFRHFPFFPQGVHLTDDPQADTATAGEDAYERV